MTNLLRGLRGASLNRAAIWLTVGPAFFCFGYNQAVAGGLLTLDSFVNTFPQMDTVNTVGHTKIMNSKIQGTVISLYTVGAIFGALSCVQLGDILGRRKVIFISTVLSMVGAILMATSFSLGQFIVARIVLGFGTGGYTATIPVWQSEISTSKNRGAHVVAEGIFVGFGITAAFWIDLGFYFIDKSSVSWRFPLAVQVILSLIVLGFIFSLPESPHWLIKKDRIEEARQVISLLAEKPDPDIVSHRVVQIQESLAVSGTSSLRDLFKMGQQRVFHRVVIGCTVQMFLQMCGISLITFYATTIFEQDLGFSPTRSRILSASMELCQPIGGGIAVFTIDRYGRRPLMLWSATAMMICMIALAGLTSDPSNTNNLIGATVFLFIFNLVFPIGFLGLPFLYTAEVAPLNLRATVSGLATATNWLFGFLVTQVTPLGFSTIQNRYYIIYAVINFLIIPTVYFCFPETKGRTLQEIDSIFIQSGNIFDPPRIARVIHSEEVQEDTGSWEKGK